MNKQTQKYQKTFQGKVVSEKMKNTVVVQIVNIFRHPLYKKTVKKTNKFMADTNGLTVKTGDKVMIVESRPISKNKHFKVLKIMEK